MQNNDKLNKLRAKINEIDQNISILLKSREKIVQDISKLKKKEKIKIQDKTREKEILESKKSGFERNVFKTILKESRKVQESLTES